MNECISQDERAGHSWPEPLAEYHQRERHHSLDLEGFVEVTTPSPVSTILERVAEPGDGWYLRRSAGSMSETHTGVGPLA